MIEPETSVGIISAVGFPIAMCLILVYRDYMKDKAKEIENKENGQNMQDVIKANTEAMVEMTTLIKERVK